MKHRLLLGLLASRQLQLQLNRPGFSLLTGLVVILALVAGTLALVTVTTGDLLGTGRRSTSRDAYTTAEAGADVIMASLNQPENRQLLVAGQPLSAWAGARSNDSFKSPCTLPDGSGPGEAGDGRPTTRATDFGNGQFQNLDAQGTRQFRLVEVTYASGDPGQPDRRRHSFTTRTDGTSSSVGAFTSALINLDDPEGDDKRPGYNSGHLTITVEGRVVRDDNTVATTTISREYQVLPKCCGASFGSGGSGGPSLVGNPESLGADGRLCGANWGLIVGATGGSMWSWEANDRYTVRDRNNDVTNLSSILGIINPQSAATTFLRSNGRVLPSPLSPAGSSDANIWNTYFYNNGDNIYQRSCRTQDARPCHGSEQDVEGSTISGIPMLPLKVQLPCVGSAQTASSCRYYFRWPSGSGAALRIAHDPSSNPRLTPGYPLINLGSGALDTHTGLPYGTSYRLRTNNDNADQPRVEECTDASCTPASWYPISAGSQLLGTFIDRFDSRSYALPSLGTASWANAWVDSETGTNAGPTTGNVQIVNILGSNRLRLGNATSTHVQRAVNLSGAENAQISAHYRKSGLESGDTLALQLCPNGSEAACETVDTYRSDTTPDNSTLQYPRPGSTSTIAERFLTANTLVRFVASGGIDPGDWIYLDDIRLKASLPSEASHNSFQPWCEASNNSPVTGAPGFHCLGPEIVMSNNAVFFIDTSGGPLSFYYNQSSDQRGATEATAVIRMDPGTAIEHVKCGGLEAAAADACTTKVSDRIYASIGIPDQLNFFGRDTGNWQWISMGLSKISGLWLYFPRGYIQLKTSTCLQAGGTPRPVNFYTDNEQWQFSGRIWVDQLRPCGWFHFRIPPSDSAPSLDSNPMQTGNFSFSDWYGVDWVARSISGARNYTERRN